MVEYNINIQARSASERKDRSLAPTTAVIPMLRAFVFNPLIVIKYQKLLNNE